MRKILIIILSIFTIIFGLGYFSYTNLSPIISQIISHKTETAVNISSINLQKNSFTISDLQIQNPQEAQLPNALKVENIDIQSSYVNYFKNPIEIQEIHLNNVYINIQIYNKDQTEGNWQTLIKNMDKDSSSFFSIERVAVIRKLILTNIQIDLILPDGELHHLSPINLLEFEDISSEKGVPIQEISDIIIQKMMKSVFLQKGLKAIIQAPINIIKGIIPFL